jgi:hypothetical protein
LGWHRAHADICKNICVSIRIFIYSRISKTRNCEKDSRFSVFEIGTWLEYVHIVQHIEL